MINKLPCIQGHSVKLVAWLAMEQVTSAKATFILRSKGPTLSEEIVYHIVYHHLSQLSVDIHLNVLIKCREYSGVQMQLTQVILRSIT